MPARILVIEDNPANMELMTYLLRAFGYQPMTAPTGELGLEAAVRDEPDIILCDIQLPGIDGIEVMRRLKGEAGVTVPVVAVTALSMVGDRDRLLSAGFDGYIGKPISPETFVKQVEAFVSENLHATGPSPGRSHAESAQARLPRTQASVLVVDNSHLNLELLQSLLPPFGYRVVAAANVREALERARETTFDLIVSDLHMPAEDGFDFLREVKADPDLRDIPFIILSATVWKDSDRSKGVEMGAAKFIARPIEPQALLDEIESVLNQRNSARPNGDDTDR